MISIVLIIQRSTLDKSASSVERIEAFIALGVDDPVQYEDETGPVDYDVAKAHVERLLAEYAA